MKYRDTPYSRLARQEKKRKEQRVSDYDKRVYRSIPLVKTTLILGK